MNQDISKIEDESFLNLTEEQKKFVLYTGKKSIIMSSTAGSGKSFCCVQRLKYLLSKGVDPKRIIFFSFTNAAVEELKARVENSDIRITTIHSFCFWVLHKMGKFKQVTNFDEFINWFEVKNRPTEDSSEKEILQFEKLISNLYDDSSFLESKISSYKLQNADSVEVDVPEYYVEYSSYLLEENKRDFSDILLDVRELLKDNKWLKMFKDRYDYLFLDEYQDTSAIQMEILMRLNAKIYYLVGDLNQSIYGYSNVNCKNIESTLEKRRKIERMSLTTNFRSAKQIVENSNNFSNLEAKTFNEFEGKICHDLIDYNKLINLINNKDEVVILARTNHIVKMIEYNMLIKKVPMKYFNFFKVSDIEDIKKGKINILTQKKIDYVLERFTGGVTDLINFIESNKDNKNFVTTIHKSKGKEFDTCVVVNSLPERLFKQNKIELPENKKEFYTFNSNMDNYHDEKNIHYVAVSRPKVSLYYMLLQF